MTLQFLWAKIGFTVDIMQTNGPSLKLMPEIDSASSKILMWTPKMEFYLFSPKGKGTKKGVAHKSKIKVPRLF